jgi:hypothetical protein
MKNHTCPHIGECKQFVVEHNFVWKCLGKISWNQENCFKSNALEVKDISRLPAVWWAMKLIETEKKE